MTAGQVTKRSSGNVPLGTPAEVQCLFEYWGRSLAEHVLKLAWVGLKH